jgi:hypothetical protein
MNTTLLEVLVRRSNFVTAALLVFPLAGAAGQGAQTGSVIEPKSKRAFPVELRVPGSDAVHALAGTAIRTKTFLKVQVYAYGLYVDAEAARSALSRWRGRSAADLQRDDAFYAELLKDNFGKTLRWVMTRDVGGEDIAEAFDESLGPRVEQAARMGMTGGMEAMEEFRTYFSVDELTKETELIFTWLPGGKLITSIGGSVKGEIDSAALSWALFDIYLGDDPIMKKGKQTVIERMPELLRGGS